MTSRVEADPTKLSFALMEARSMRHVLSFSFLIDYLNCPPPKLDNMIMIQVVYTGVTN